ARRAVTPSAARADPYIRHPAGIRPDFLLERTDVACHRTVHRRSPRARLEALTKPEHLKERDMPKAWGRVARTEMDVRPGGIFSIDIATADGQDFPNLGCFLEVIPMERLVWTSMLF